METYKKVTWISVVVTIIIAGVLAYFLFFNSDKGIGEMPETLSDKPSETSAENTTEISVDKDEKPSIPDFTQIPEDSVIRELIEVCSDHPEWKKWIQKEGLIEAAVALIDNIVQGQDPTVHLDPLNPQKKFPVKIKGQFTYMDPKGFGRYDKIVEVFCTIDTAYSVQLYKKMLPALEGAFGELGYENETFVQRIAEAVQVILEAPVITNDIELKQKVVTYTIVDPNLERLKPFQKHLLRMGPENQKKIQNKVRVFAISAELIKEQ